MKKWIVASLIIVIQYSVFGQTLVRGTVTDVKGEPLFGANVYIENTYDGTSSNADGKYEFKTDEKGDQNLKIEYLGYKPIKAFVHLNGQPVEFHFELEEQFSELNAVVITAGSFEASDRKRAIELSSVDIATTAGAMGDIVGAINTLPGTTPVGESGRLYVRGGSSEETKTFIDGLLVSQPYHSAAPNLSTRGRFNPFLFSGTIFNTGGYSAEYGQALSSVLLLNTINEKQKDELNLSFLLGLGADFAGTKSWESGSITASGNYFNMKPYMTLVKQNQEWSKPAEFYSQETSFKQKTGKSGIFKLYSNVNQSRFGLLQNDLDQPGQKINYELKNSNYFLNTSWTNALSEKWMLFAGASTTLNSDEIRINVNPLSEKLHAAHLKLGFDYQLAEKINLHFGTDYFHEGYTYSIVYDTLNFRQHLNNDLYVGFAEANIYTSNKLVFRIGGRAEYSTFLSKYNFSPRFSSAYKIDDYSQVSFAYGWFFQSPQNFDLLFEDGLTFQRADHFVLNYQKSINKRMFRAEVFYKDYSHLIKYKEDGYRNRSNYSNKGYGDAYGLDVFFRDAKTIKNGHFWISYSYLETERDFRNYPYLTTPEFASKHNFSIVYKHFSEKLRSMIGGDFSYSSPRNYNDPNQEAFNASKMKAYYSLNVSWAYLWKDQVIIYAAVNNVLGRNQEYGYRFSTQPDEDGIYAREPIVPQSRRFYLLGVFFTFSKDKAKNQLDKIN